MDSSFVASSFKRGFQKSNEHFFSQFFVNKTSRDTKHIGIVVLTSQRSQLLCPAQRRTHTGMFVGRHAYAVSAAAYQNTGSSICIFYGGRHGMCMIRIVCTILTVSAFVHHLPTQ